MLRKLGIFEKAMLISNQHAPFNIVSVLRMENAPAPEIVQKALAILQRRQPFLRARIMDGKFEALSSANFPFAVTERTARGLWREIAEKEMAYHYDHEKGPLFRATYVYSDNVGELILNVHHTIMDAVSGMNLLDELLHLCSGEITDLPPLEFAPVFEERFPPSHRGLRRALNLTGYALSQMAETATFALRTRGKRIPPMHLGGRGHTKTLILPEELVDALSRMGRKKGVTLNSLMNAALVLAVNKHLYEGASLPMQTFAFADLRPYTVPPTGSEQLANYISMMRFTVDVSGEMRFWDLAETLHAKIYSTLKKGDKFNAALMSESLLKMFTTMKAMRFGATALNYSGSVPIKTQYGEIKLVGLHGFVSGYDLGPEMASQARLFNDEIWWDFIYLNSDMDARLAESILAEIKLILERASQTHV